MEEIAPGSILQRMYLKNRLRRGRYKTFCEIGSGNGYVASILLENGMIGKGFDLNKDACKNNTTKNKSFIEDGIYSVKNGNFFNEPIDEKFDIIISSMVIEHLNENEVRSYFENCKKYLNKRGKIIVLVPACMTYWGIEDEIAGHYKRYEFSDFQQIAAAHSLKIVDIAGLTYPLSNIFFSISNYLVKKNEAFKKNLSMQEQTVLSGNRNVKFKTSFPKYYKLFLNEVVMYPFYILQRIFKNNSNSMVIYCEFTF